VANHRRETGLDSITANPPGLPHVPAPNLDLLDNHLLIHLGFGLVVKRLVLIISARKVTALF